MKQKIYIVVLVNLLLIFSGAIFKVNHWPAAGIMLTLGLSSLVIISIPLALISNYKGGNDQRSLLLHIVTWLTCFVVFTGMLFKIMHWPYAGLALTIALPFPYIVFLPVFIAVTSGNRNFNIYNTVFVLLLLALNSVFSVLLSLNVSKQRISDSYNLSRNYNNIEMILSSLPVSGNQSPMNDKIDLVIKTVNEYESMLLKDDGISPDQWKKDPESLARPDSRQAAVKVLFNAENPVGNKLEKELISLVDEISKVPEYKYIAAISPVLFDVTDSAPGGSGWTYRNFVGPTLSWSLIYLDGLKADLLRIKAAVN
jgi:hypothetical protein